MMSVDGKPREDHVKTISLEDIKVSLMSIRAADEVC